MSKIPSLFEVISRPPTLRESEIVKEMNRRIKKFDEYERIDGYRCALCPPDANWHPASEIYPDDEHGDLCKRCLDEVEEERELIEQEKKLHHSGKCNFMIEKSRNCMPFPEENNVLGSANKKKEGNRV